jgi:hypothetical protein
MPDYQPMPATWQEYAKQHGDPRERLEEEHKHDEGKSAAPEAKEGSK